MGRRASQSPFAFFVVQCCAGVSSVAFFVPVNIRKCLTILDLPPDLKMKLMVRTNTGKNFML